MNADPPRRRPNIELLEMDQNGTVANVTVETVPRVQNVTGDSGEQDQSPAAAASTMPFWA